MSANASISVSSGSQNTLTSVILAPDPTTKVLTAQTSADTTAYVTVKDAAGATALATTPMVYQAPSSTVAGGTWQYIALAAVWVRGNGPWKVITTVYDQTGSGGGNLRRTEYVDALDREYP